MPELPTQEVTQLLAAWSVDQAALDRLLALVEAELHRLAQTRRRQGSFPGR